MEVYTGTSGFGYKEWKGNFYPEDLSAKKMLPFYANRFSTVEINNTFYRMPTATVVASWAEQVPQGFLFTLKAPQIITHIKRLQGVGEETRYFLGVISVLDKKLGCILFQFPASFHKNLKLLEGFIDIIPPKVHCAFDFRSASWFGQDTFDLLGKRKFCLGIEDTDENPINEIHRLTSWGYYRMRRQDYTDRGLKKWAEKFLSQKWEKLFVLFKHEDDSAAKGPALALRFAEIVKQL